MKFKNLKLLVSMSCLILILAACNEDDAAPRNMGSVQFEITDAPIDDASVKSVFVTVADIKVDGQSISGFNKTTIDVLAFQNGNTSFLADTELEAKTYTDLTLVLDFENDENGDQPGCYVAEEDGSTKHPLFSSSNEISVQSNFEVISDLESKVVVDFDLRKCVQRENKQDDQYEFVSNAEFRSGIRVVTKNETGVVKGKCNDSVSNSDKIVVYAYKKGEYNRDTETSAQGQSEIEFANAVSSSSVNASGNFEMHFLEKGDYELVYCSYKENAQNEMKLEGTLMIGVLGTINLSSVSVDAAATVDVEVNVSGMLPL